MEPNSEHIESVLRSAPTPVPPPDLKAKLLSQVRERYETESNRSGNRSTALLPGFQAAAGGWRRWMLMLLPAGAAVALGATVWVQQQRLDEMREVLSQSAATQPTTISTGAEADAPLSASRSLPDERSEILRLRALVSILEKEAEAVRLLEQENDRLKAMIAAGTKAMPAEFRELAEAKDRAGAIQCVNHLKQLGLAVRIYTSENSDEFPADIGSLGKYLGTPKVLVCPADTGRQAAESWETFSSANVSYEFLSPGPGKFEHEPTRVLFRCPFHGHVGLCDGSVQMDVMRKNPGDLVMRDGVLYMESRGGAPSKAGQPTIQVRGPLGIPPELARRYGLMTDTNVSVPADGGAGETRQRSFEVMLEKDGEVVKVLRTVVVDANGNEVQVDDAGVVVPDEAEGVEKEELR